jgi:hypothetical protein
MFHLLVRAVPCVLLLAMHTDDGPQPSSFKRIPWHLVKVHCVLGHHEDPLTSFAITFTIHGEVSLDDSVYISVANGWMNKQFFYGGVLSQIPDACTKTDRRLRKLGPGLIFSRWGDMDPNAIRLAYGGHCFFSDNEGKHVSCRTEYRWAKGTYRLKFVTMDVEHDRGIAYRWVGAFLELPKTDECLFIGALRFRGEDIHLEPHFTAFLEVFKKPTSVAGIPKASVTLESISVNDKETKIIQAWAVFDDDVPEYGNATIHDGKITLLMGEPRADRKQKEKWLIGP